MLVFGARCPSGPRSETTALCLGLPPVQPEHPLSHASHLLELGHCGHQASSARTWDASLTMCDAMPVFSGLPSVVTTFTNCVRCSATTADNTRRIRWARVPILELLHKIWRVLACFPEPANSQVYAALSSPEMLNNRARRPHRM